VIVRVLDVVFWAVLSMKGPGATYVGRVTSIIKASSCSHIQRLSKKMVAAFDIDASHPISGIASLGDSGKYPNNVERDLHTWVEPALAGGLKPKYKMIRIENPDGPGLVEVDHPVLMPADLVHHMWELGPKVFSRCLLGSESLSNFWECSSAMYTGHPHLHLDRLDYTIPIWIHGDAAKVYKASPDNPTRFRATFKIIPGIVTSV
jgi:hypothetical protein